MIYQRTTQSNAGLQAYGGVKRGRGDGCVGACANQSLQAASTTVPALNTPSPIRLEARRNGLAPGAWPAGTCHRRSTRAPCCDPLYGHGTQTRRSEEHTSELKSLMRTSYAVFCL